MKSRHSRPVRILLRYAGTLTAMSFALPVAFPAAAAGSVPMVELAPGTVQFYSTDIRLVKGAPVAPERLTIQFPKPLHIMQRQVSQAEYAECVRGKGCKPLDRSASAAPSPDLPVVGVSWQDATDFARWYSAKTGDLYRLPTFAEWVRAAGETYKEELRMDLYGAEDPSTRWLAEYAMESQRKAAVDPAPKPFGAFGTNAAGVQDMGGNVWEWTDTCNVRHYLDEQGNAVMPALESCGIRVVAGSHYSMITDFMRDPKSGACSVGVPPSNLGIRLVRESHS